jgi:hypothetical protein
VDGFHVVIPLVRGLVGRDRVAASGGLLHNTG